MLSWPAGPRDSDGVWAPYWYDSVHASTGFAPYRPPGGPAAARLEPLAERCLPYFSRLHSYRISAFPPQEVPMLQVFDERNRDLIVNVGGKLSHRDQAGVSPFDSAVQGGDAVWEGPAALPRADLPPGRAPGPAARLGPGARVRAGPPAEEIIEQIRRTLAANGMRDGVHIRLTLTRGVKLTSGMDPRLNTSGPTLIVLAEFKDPVYDPAGITLVTASVRRPAPDCLDPKIHHNNLLPSILAKIEANVAGADDAVMLDHRGFIAETNATHIFMVIRRHAGHPDHRVLPGGHHPGGGAGPGRVGRPALPRGDYTLPQLYTADEAFVTGTMGGLAPVVRRRRPDHRRRHPGPVTKQPCSPT
jgi:branched-chain amino acid aminotransferase